MPPSELPLTAAELVLRSQRPDRWPPPFGDAEVALRLSGGSGDEFSLAWAVIVPRRQTEKAIIREGAITRQAFLNVMNAAQETTQSLMAADLVRVRDVSIPLSVVQPLLQSAAQLTVPVVGMSRNDGVDGTTFHLSATSGQCATELVWWASGPPEWGALTAWARTARQLLRELAAGAPAR
jgi:hypothetical protein